MEVLQGLAEGFRPMFYLMGPSEAKENLEDVPNYIAQATPFFIIMMIMEIIVSSVEGKQYYRFNDGFSSISQGMFQQICSALVKNLDLVMYLVVYPYIHFIDLPWDSAWTWWIAFLTVDFGYYWFHRMAHEVNILWAGHSVHHSSEEYNLSTALRQGAWQAMTSWIFYLPLGVAVPPSVFAAHKQFNTLYQFWIHTRMIDNLGPLEYILNTPKHHRVHHGANRYCIDKNYAGTLIIWDRIFDTFEWEADEVVYGLTHNLNTWNPITAQSAHMVHIFRTAYETPGLLNKVKVFMYGPGWAPGKPRTGLIEDIPDVHAPQPKYNAKPNFGTQLYVGIHFAILIVIYSVTMNNRSLMDANVFYAICAMLFWSLTSFGMMMDRDPRGTVLEAGRLMTLGSLPLVASLYGRESLIDFMGFDATNQTLATTIAVLTQFIGLSTLFVAYRIGKELSSGPEVVAVGKKID
eukprot:Clim_evm28s236 gene=Clim_evmTU28s236